MNRGTWCGSTKRKSSDASRVEQMTDARLCEAVDRAGKGLIDANLDGGLTKQRIARQGQGRSGGYRALMAFRVKERTVFVYGFPKNERCSASHAD